MNPRRLASFCTVSGTFTTLSLGKHDHFQIAWSLYAITPLSENKGTPNISNWFCIGVAVAMGIGQSKKKIKENDYCEQRNELDTSIKNSHYAHFFVTKLKQATRVFSKILQVNK